MVHCGPPVALLIPRLIVPHSLPDSLPPSLSLSLRVAAIPHRSSRCATANSHLPKRVCYVQVHGNVVSGNQIQVLREKVKRQERAAAVRGGRALGGGNVREPLLALLFLQVRGGGSRFNYWFAQIFSTGKGI